MKNYLFYLFGFVLFFYTCTFTSCVNGVDDEYLDQIITETGGNTEEEELPYLSGNYIAGGDNSLSLTYNGQTLDGKQVTVIADDLNETATITLAGTQLDFGGLIPGQVNFNITSSSPVPGVKELVLSDIKLFRNGDSYRFVGEYKGTYESGADWYTLAYDGIIEGENMTLNLTQKLANDPLAGTWALSAPYSQGDALAKSPFWCDWDSQVKISIGRFDIGLGFPIPVNSPFNTIFSLVTGDVMGPGIIGAIAGVAMPVENIITNMLKSVTAVDGCIFATYNYGGDITSTDGPWSSEMSHNMLRYYYDETGKLYLALDPQLIYDLATGLLNPVSKAYSSNKASTKTMDEAFEIAARLVTILTPLMEEGIPMEYTIENGKMIINPDGVVVRDIMRILMELLQEPDIVKPWIDEAIAGAGLGDYANSVQLMLSTMPNATIYKNQSSTGVLSGECGYTKFGLKFDKSN